ncbi:MAG: peroxiredoxin [Opitutaceae bacterium]|nr:peroxiredoxin [Opitutaceae bacterium]|tara:strand:+ start:381 stop:884 length:504 start_codon:yes stop_codon:yes gene_type:complete
MRKLSPIFVTLIMLFAKVAKASPLEIGANLPRIEAVLDSGESKNLSERETDDYLLVYFYPKANTPGCIKQACSLRDAYEDLLGKGVTIFGVSKDSVKSQQSFKEKYDIPFSLVADSKSKVIKAFGVPTKVGFANRQAYLFKKGKLVWRDLAASTVKQAEDILNFLNE